MFEVGIKFDDNIVALFMVGNLGAQFESFRQCLVGSGQIITVERVKAGLMELSPLQSSNKDPAFYGGPSRNVTKRSERSVLETRVESNVMVLARWDISTANVLKEMATVWLKKATVWV